MFAGGRLLQRVLGGTRRQEGIDSRGPAEVRRILVVELWNIGDVVLTLPFLAQLRAKFPNARVTFLGGAHAEPLLRGTGLVDQFLKTDLGFGAVGLRTGGILRLMREMRRLGTELRRMEFDLAFQSRLHFREQLLLSLSCAKRTFGYALGGRSLLTDPIAVTDQDRQKADDWMEMLKPFGEMVNIDPPRLAVSSAEAEWADVYLAERGIPPEIAPIGIHPGASKAEKRWPLERFESVAENLVKRSLPVLAFAEPSGYGASLGSVGGVALAQVNLRQMIALVARCRLLVCNDSGPMHIAGALGVPSAAVFAASVSRWFAPLGTGHQIVTGGRGEFAGSKRVGAGVESVATDDVLRAIGVILARS